MKQCKTLFGLCVTGCLLLAACASVQSPVAVAYVDLPQPNHYSGYQASAPALVSVTYPRKLGIRLNNPSDVPKVTTIDPATTLAIQALLDKHEILFASAEEVDLFDCLNPDGSKGAFERPKAFTTHTYQFPLYADVLPIIKAFQELGFPAMRAMAGGMKGGFGASYYPQNTPCSVVPYQLIPEVVE
jgi:hypothetical protein